MARRRSLWFAAPALAAFCALLVLAMLAPAADAHALLVRSDPTAGQVLAASPTRILLTFSETPDPTLSKAYVSDSHGNQKAGVSQVQAVPGKPLELALTVSKPLPKGWYSLQWLSVSQIDGHAANGIFTFGVGVAPPKVSPFGSVEGTSASLTTLADVGRWLLYIGLALLLGGAAVTLFALDACLPAGYRVTLWLAWLLALAGAGTMTLAEQHIVGASSLLPLFLTPAGHKFLVLTVLVGLGCGVAVMLVDLMPGRATLWILAGVVALVMVVHAEASHADAATHLEALHLLEQWAHMMAVGVWVGGLLWLLLALRPQAGFDRPVVIARFSRLAGYALAAVLLTGLLRAFTELGSIHALLFTSYGRALMVKVALVLVIVALGALNRYRYVPEAGTGSGAVEGLRRAVRGEVVTGAAILAATAVLAGLAPAAGVLAPASGATTQGSDFGLTTKVSLTVTPAAVGRNSFTAKVTDYQSGQHAPATAVQLQFSLPSRPALAASTLSLRRTSSGTWQARGAPFALAGAWSVTVLVQTPSGGVSIPLTVTVAGT